MWKVQVDPHRDVVGPMAPLRGKEEPRGSSDLKDPNGAPLDVEEPREFPTQETPNGASPALEKLQSRPKLAITLVDVCHK